MQVVILCGGQGTRLRELTDVIPKPMVEIGGRPILWHIMKMYSHQNFKDFVLCLGYKGDVIRSYFLQYDLYNTDITIELGTGRKTPHDSLHEEHGWQVTLLETGSNTMTGGRIQRAAPFVKGDTFLATYGDGVANIDIGRVLAFHHEMGRIATVTAVRPVARFGEMEIDGNLVSRFSEKPQVGEGWINGGFFVFNRKVVEYLDGDDCILERHPMERLATEGQLAVYKHDGYWRCMDTLRDVQALNEEWDSGAALWADWKGSPVARPD